MADDGKEMPFRFRWCYEDEEEGEICRVLLLGTPDTVTPLHIDITNKLIDKTITIYPLDGITEANSTNYHFKLAFYPGILADPEAISLESDNWSISFVRDETADSLYLLWTGDREIILQPDEGIEVILTGVAAQTLTDDNDTTDVTTRSSASTKAASTATTTVTISWQLEEEGIEIINIARIPDQENPYELSIELELEMVQTTGKSNIPLFVGFVNCNKVLNTNNESSDLQLRITNTNLPNDASPDITFLYDSEINLSSELIIMLDVGTVSNTPWALGTNDEVNDISIEIEGGKWKQRGNVQEVKVGNTVKALQWSFIPKNDNVVLPAQETMLINLSNIVTNHPKGETNLYLYYKRVKDYKDGKFTCQIEKGPLVFDNNNNVKIDTNLDFHRHYRQNIDLYGSNNGIGIQSNTVYFRSDSDFGWYSEGSHNATALSPGSGGTVMMSIHNGKLGIGTASPTSKLDVHGDAYIKDELGIGTTSPSAKLDVRGDAYIEDELGIGTYSPSAKLDVRGDAYIAGNTQITGGAEILSKVDIGTISSYTNLSVTGKINADELNVDGDIQINAKAPMVLESYDRGEDQKTHSDKVFKTDYPCAEWIPVIAGFAVAGAGEMEDCDLYPVKDEQNNWGIYSKSDGAVVDKVYVLFIRKELCENNADIYKYE